jgi:ankyrin repeat protein
MKNKIIKTMAVIPFMFGALCSGCGGRSNVEKYFVNGADREFVCAVLKGDKTKVDQMLRAGTSVDCRGIDGMTPLLFAIVNSDKQATLLLLSKGANPNLQDNHGEYSPMSLAAGIKDTWLLETLLKNGGNPNLRDKLKETPIFQAVECLRKVNIDILLKAGADINAQNVSGKTPMMDAGDLRLFDMVLYLLQLGADPKIEDNWHYTILYSIQTAVLNPVGIKERDKVVDWLKQRNLWRIEEEKPPVNLK